MEDKGDKIMLEDFWRKIFANIINHLCIKWCKKNRYFFASFELRKELAPL